MKAIKMKLPSNWEAGPQVDISDDQIYLQFQKWAAYNLVVGPRDNMRNCKQPMVLSRLLMFPTN